MTKNTTPKSLDEVMDTLVPLLFLQMPLKSKFLSTHS